VGNKVWKNVCSEWNIPFIDITNQFSMANLSNWKNRDAIHLSLDVGVPKVIAIIVDHAFRESE